MCIRISEDEFLDQVVELAQLCGWKAHHSRPARTAKGWCTPIQGDVGFPDLMLAKSLGANPHVGALVVAELKAETGRLTIAQREWLVCLSSTGAYVFVWVPSLFEEVVGVLRAGGVADIMMAWTKNAVFVGRRFGLNLAMRING